MEIRFYEDDKHIQIISLQFSSNLFRSDIQFEYFIF